MDTLRNPLPLTKGNLILVTETFTADGLWIRPNNLVGDAVYLDMIGGGGGGGYGRVTTDFQGGNGGNGGAFVLDRFIDISSIAVGESVAVTVGNGGEGAAYTGTYSLSISGGVGSPSSFGAFYSVSGGAEGLANSVPKTQGGFLGGCGGSYDPAPYYATSGTGPFAGIAGTYGGGGGSGLFSTEFITTEIRHNLTDMSHALAGRGYGAGGYGSGATSAKAGKGANGLVIVKYFIEA